MYALLYLFVLLQSVIYLPMINAAGHRTIDVTPVVIEANATQASGPAACLEELAPAVNAAQALCPIPGQHYPALYAAGQTALIGNHGDGSRAVWAGAGAGRVIAPEETVNDATIIEIGASVTGMNTDPGAITHSGPYRLIALLPVDETSRSAEPAVNAGELIEFAGYLKSLIDDTESILINLNRSGWFYDETGENAITAAAKGCGSGDQISWVATGPFRIRNVVGGPRIIFKGEFNDPAINGCMAPHKWVEVARLYDIPAVKQQVDNYRGATSSPTWNWGLGDGLQRALTWSGWDYLILFGIRLESAPAPSPTYMFFLIPDDFLDLNCVFLNGEKVCTVEQTPGQ